MTGLAERPRVHPALGLVLYFVGYGIVLVGLSLAGGILLGILMTVGGVPPERLDAIGETAFDTEALLEALGPWFFPVLIVLGVFTILYTWVFVRFIEGRSYGGLGVALRPGWFGSFLKGAGIAALLAGAMFGVSVWSGEIEVLGFASPNPEGLSLTAYMILSVLGFIAVGYYEELMFRGYMLQRLDETMRWLIGLFSRPSGTLVAPSTERVGVETAGAGAAPWNGEAVSVAPRAPAPLHPELSPSARMLGRYVAIFVSSFVFSLAHVLNPGAGFLSLVNIILIGVLLCVLYYRSGALWVPIGFHFAWNFLLGMFFSVPVSGMPVYGVLEVREVAEDGVVSGAGFGPEGGLASTFVMVVFALWLLFSWSRRASERDR